MSNKIREKLAVQVHQNASQIIAWITGLGFLILSIAIGSFFALGLALIFALYACLPTHRVVDAPMSTLRADFTTKIVTFENAKLTAISAQYHNGEKTLYLTLEHEGGNSQKLEKTGRASTFGPAIARLPFKPLNTVLDTPETWEDLNKWMKSGERRAHSFMTRSTTY